MKTKTFGMRQVRAIEKRERIRMAKKLGMSVRTLERKIRIAKARGLQGIVDTKNGLIW